MRYGISKDGIWKQNPHLIKLYYRNLFHVLFSNTTDVIAM